MRLHPIVTLAAAVALALPAAASAKPQARVCPAPSNPGTAQCDAHVIVNAKGAPQATSGPTGYGPADLQAAYGLAAAAASAGGGQTIAIVDAYNAPTAEADLAVYRSTYGLPACTKANGCFRQVNQTGGTSLPRNNAGWAQEIALDLDVASATCPNCKLLLVEAKSNSFTNLFAAEDYATSHASIVSNSWGGSEFSGQTGAAYDGHFNRPGVAITVSSGDAGYGAEYPASSQYVTAVGGTSLSRAGTGWSERAWSGAGSGCSAYSPKPAWQKDTGCARRTIADVSAVADPNTGVSVYDSYAYQGSSGWMVFGGTSASAPLIAGVYGLAGNATSTSYASYPYAHAGSLHDVVTGSNGTCSGSYLCTSLAGFDGPTGLGTPNGTGAF